MDTTPHTYKGRADDLEPVTYFALDLERAELERTLSELMAKHGDDLVGKVAAKGMWGTYDGGIKFIQEGGLETLDDHHGVDTPLPHQTRFARADFESDEQSHLETASSVSTRDFSVSTRGDYTPPSSPGTDAGSKRSSAAPLRLMFLGSSIGNFDRESATSFLKDLPLRPGSGDSLLLGLDHDNSKEEIELAYNDRKGITKEFIMQGLKEAGNVLGKGDLFENGKWEYVNRYNVEKRAFSVWSFVWLSILHDLSPRPS